MSWYNTVRFHESLDTKWYLQTPDIAFWARLPEGCKLGMFLNRMETELNDKKECKYQEGVYKVQTFRTAQKFNASETFIDNLLMSPSRSDYVFRFIIDSPFAKLIHAMRFCQ